MYLIDSDVFIDAKNGVFGFDICPGFWSWIVDANRRGIVFSVDEVKDELVKGEDELAEWARLQSADFFLKPDLIRSRPSFSEVSEWATHSDFFEMGAARKFLDGADYYLVAQAHALGFVVVTNEGVSDTPKIIRIPNACDALKVKRARLHAMLRQEQARFVMEN